MTSKPPFGGEVVRVGDVCTLVFGQSPSSDSYNADGDGLPFYQGNADFGKEHPKAKVWCNAPKKTARAGDILLSVRAPIGAVNTAEEVCCIGRGVAAVRPNPSKVNAVYLKQQLLARRALLESKGTGSTFKAVGKKVLTEFPVILYSLSEQEALARKLQTIQDNLRVADQKLFRLDLLVKSRFVEMFGTAQDPKYAVVPVENVCSAIVDCPHETPKYEGCLVHPAIRTSELTGTGISWETMKYVSDEEYLRRIRRIKPLPGDVVYAREGTYGNAAVLPEGHDFCLGQRTMLFRPKAELCLSNYLLHALTSVDVKRQADELNVGSTVPHVNVRDAKRFAIPMPPIREQQEFADFVAQVDKLRFVVAEFHECRCSPIG